MRLFLAFANHAITLLLTAGGAVFGILLAMVFAIVKINRVKVLYPIQAFFVSFLRGTPLLVQLMLTYFGIPLLLKAINQKYGTSFNINEIPASVFAIVAFAFNEAAYASETIRAAILSVDPGEIEAARSLGMTNKQVYMRVIIPNAAVVATPAVKRRVIGRFCKMPGIASKTALKLNNLPSGMNLRNSSYQPVVRR